MPTKRTAVDYSYRYLNRYPKTEKELRLQLYKKRYTEKEINTAILYMKKNKLIDDENFCKLYIQSEAIKKGKPTFIIKGKLREKWVDKHIIDKYISEYNKEIENGINQKLIQEMEKLKKKGDVGFDIIQKLNRRWYSIWEIKKAIKLRDKKKEHRI